MHTSAYGSNTLLFSSLGKRRTHTQLLINPRFCAILQETFACHLQCHQKFQLLSFILRMELLQLRVSGDLCLKKDIEDV